MTNSVKKSSVINDFYIQRGIVLHADYFRRTYTPMFEIDIYILLKPICSGKQSDSFFNLIQPLMVFDLIIIKRKMYLEI